MQCSGLNNGWESVQQLICDLYCCALTGNMDLTMLHNTAIIADFITARITLHFTVGYALNKSTQYTYLTLHRAPGHRVLEFAGLSCKVNFYEPTQNVQKKYIVDF